MQSAAGPQPPRLVEEGCHLRGYAAVAGRCANDDGVVVRQFVDCSNWRLLVQFEVAALSDCLRHRLRHPLDLHTCAAGARAFRHCASHLLDVAIGRVIQNENFCHTPLRRMKYETLMAAAVAGLPYWATIHSIPFELSRPPGTVNLRAPVKFYKLPG